ncbi:transporter substrate-binding domain-containing protein [Nonomuraea sp. NPDC026600]|uniref:transporter substrate-binding domain-containing protein n=1 Tax=Nonomuraea sp. NPDC026600 TaxID=3155363 RepID=UPI0033C27FD3
MNIRTSIPLMKATTAVALLGTVLGASACGASLNESKSAVNVPSQDDGLAKMLPKAVRDKGTITVAAAVYAPAVMVPPGGGEPTGWDIQITRETAALLGLKVKFTIIPFDGVIPGLQAGRYDAATGEINVTDDRTKVVRFVVNHVSRDAFMVKADSKYAKFQDPLDTCGLVVGASLGSSEAALANKLATGCETAGKDPLTVKTFADQATVNLALSQGRIVANLASGSQVAYSVKQSKGKFKVTEMGFGPEIKTGFVLPNNAYTAEMAKAFEAATNKLIETGGLQRILNEQNLGLGAVKKSEVIPPVEN